MRWGRAYFAIQAVVGGAWWVAVAVSPFVRSTTLGSLDAAAVAIFDIPLFVVASALAAMGLRWAAAVSTAWTTLVAVALAVYAMITTEAGWGVLVMAAAAGGSIVALCLVFLGRLPTEWIINGPFAFRRAKVRSAPAGHVATTFAQILVFWGFFLAVFPLVIAFLEQRWQVGISFPLFLNVTGLVLLVLASALGISSAITMSTLGNGTPLPSAMPNRLVIAGAYRFIRNPMAAAGILQGIAVGLLLSSWLVIVYAVVGCLIWNYAVRPLEEDNLEANFGEDFVRYRDSVSCWIPRSVSPSVVRS